MKKLNLFITLLFLTTCSFSQVDIKYDSLTHVIENQNLIIDSLTQNNIILKDPGTLKPQEGIDSSTSRKEVFQFLFPSLIAIIVSLIALGGNIYLGAKHLEASERRLNKQLKESKKTVAQQINSAQTIIEKQIQSAQEIAKQQITLGIDNAQLNFRQNVLSTNRQNWINQLRQNISEIVSLVHYHGLRKEMGALQIKELNQLITKTQLMLNPVKDKEYIDSLDNLESILLNVVTKDAEYTSIVANINEVLRQTKSTLKTEWERVKIGD